MITSKNVLSLRQAKSLTEKIITNSDVVDVTKLPIDNIVFGKLSEIPLLEMMLNLNIVTKEHIEGTMYPKGIFQMVMRIIGGKVLMRGSDLIERPDVYAWSYQKVQEAKNKRNIGFNSTEGALTYAEVVATIQTQREKELFTQMLVSLKQDLMLIHTDVEHRECIPVTEEFLAKFEIDAVANSYDIEYPPEGTTTVLLTPIEAGDLLILEQTSFGTAFYVVGKDEAELTYLL